MRKVELRLGETVLSFFTDEPEDVVREVFGTIVQEFENAKKRYRSSNEFEILAHLLVNTTLENVQMRREIEKLRQKYQLKLTSTEEVMKSDEDRAF
ncbi:MAG: hypothetical protein PWP37_1188 [Thermotogota bacterium]|nr:hypothetical protein [Thermotogota bacterium]MDK2864996.1 hypothetical protein [Thermotogota bacterium]